jgi:hypothetical protein
MVEGFDLSAFNRLWPQREGDEAFPVPLTQLPHTPLANPTTALLVELQGLVADGNKPVSNRVSFTIRGGVAGCSVGVSGGSTRGDVRTGKGVTIGNDRNGDTCGMGDGVGDRSDVRDGVGDDGTVTCHALALWVDFDTGGGGWISTGPGETTPVAHPESTGGDDGSDGGGGGSGGGSGGGGGGGAKPSGKGKRARGADGSGGGGGAVKGVTDGGNGSLKRRLRSCTTTTAALASNTQGVKPAGAANEVGNANVADATDTNGVGDAGDDGDAHLGSNCPPGAGPAGVHEKGGGGGGGCRREPYTNPTSFQQGIVFLREPLTVSKYTPASQTSRPTS